MADVRFAGADTFYLVDLTDGGRVEVAGRYGQAAVGESVLVGLAPDAPPLPAFSAVAGTSESEA